MMLPDLSAIYGRYETLSRLARDRFSDLRPRLRRLAHALLDLR